MSEEEKPIQEFSTERDPEPEPVKKQKLSCALYLDLLPSSKQYEKSYMHKDTILALTCSPLTGFIATAGADGFIKFWKKQYLGIEFMKSYRAHMTAVTCLTLSIDGSRLATCSSHERSIKIFDVGSFDMINMLKVEFSPEVIAFVHRSNTPESVLAVANGKDILCLSGEGEAAVLRSFSVHLNPVKLMRYNAAFDSGISIDVKGFIEYWRTDNGEMPQVAFEAKTDTDLFELARRNCFARSLNVSPNGKLFAVYCSDRCVRVFQYLTGRLMHTYNETYAMYDSIQEDPSSPLRLEKMEFHRRMALERELDHSDTFVPSLDFDDSSTILIYPTYVGIKFISLQTNRILRLLGKNETERFTQICLYGGKPMKNMSGKAGMGGSSSQGDKTSDPTLFCLSFKKNRFFLFTKKPPADADTTGPYVSRDIMNEKPSKEETAYSMPKTVSTELAEKAIVHTTMGDIYIKLFSKEAPKAVENFTQLSKNGYYDQVIFHRVCRGFMIQTGDPEGDGTGGQSIWGTEFEDEFHPSLKHDRPFTVSMANKGSNTNGSQFFITVVPATWLDGRHTIFGRVYKGMDVVETIESVPVDRQEKPMAAIRITHVSVDA